MKSFTSRVGIVVASLTLAAAPAFAQKPSESGGAPAGAVDRSSGGGAGASSGAAVDRGGGGGSAASSAASSGGGGSASSTSSMGAGGFTSPAAAAASPSISFGDRAVREFAPQHRSDFRGNATRYSDDGQKATPRSSGPSSGGNSGGAVSRGAGSSSGSSGAAGTRAGSGSNDNGSGRTPTRARTGSAPEATAPDTNNATGTREVPTWARPRGDRPTTGQAVERTVPPPDRDGHYTGRSGYYNGFGYYNPYGSYGYGYGPYGSYYYPYGFGMGYGLYSGFGWAPYYGDPFGDPYGYGSGGGYSGSSASSYGRGEQGNLKLKVKPRSAKVYVDGYFVGPVDQFDGAFQKLALNTGRHKVEIKADGFETAEFDVLINPEQTVTFQGELKRIQ
jgi:hypothetical protein